MIYPEYFDRHTLGMFAIAFKLEASAPLTPRIRVDDRTPRAPRRQLYAQARLRDRAALHRDNVDKNGIPLAESWSWALGL